MVDVQWTGKTGPFLCMNEPDFDDYYSLSEYASRFVSNPEKYISLWISQVSVLSRIELWEVSHGNALFRKDTLPLFIAKIENDELLDLNEVISALSLTSILIEDGEVFADKSIYYDFVGFLLSSFNR